MRRGQKTKWTKKEKKSKDSIERHPRDRLNQDTSVSVKLSIFFLFFFYYVVAVVVVVTLSTSYDRMKMPLYISDEKKKKN